MTLKDLPKIDYGAHPLYGGMFTPDPVLGQRTEQVLQPLVDQAGQVERQRSAHFGYRYKWSDALTEELAHQGAGKLQFGTPVMDKIQAAAQPIIDLVKARIGQAREAGEPIRYKTALEALTPTDHSELWRLVERIVQDAGVHEATSTVFDAPSAKLRSLAVLINVPNQDWATRLYRDVEVEAPPTAGFHIDSDGKCFTKMVLYLTDVGPEQGPFGIVRQSHRWSEGSPDRVYRCAFDKSDLVVRSAKRRRMFLSLPKHLQTKAEFGGDMLAGSPEAQDLLAQESVMVGPRGQLNLFNPDAIHRGGNVRQGERHVLLISVGPRWHAAPP
jgi:hypothetical protein